MSDDEIFLARDDEQERLRGVLRQVISGQDESGHGYLVLVHGLGGIGKSTLLKRYRRIARGELSHDRNFAGKFVLAKVNWEELRRQNPGLYPAGGPPLWRALDDIYHAIIDAVKPGGRSSTRQANRAFERFRERAAQAKDEHLALEQGSPGVDIAETIIGQVASIGSLLPVPYAKQGSDAVKQVTATAADVTRKARQGKISPDRYERLVRPDEALVRAFADGIRELSRKRPVILSLDTVEMLAENCLPLFGAIKHSGSKVLWIVGMRLEDDDHARENSVIGPFLNAMPSSLVRLVVPNRFTSADIEEYLNAKLGDCSPPGVAPRAVHDVTHGIPLAVQLVVDSIKSGMPSDEALSEVTSSGEVSAVVRGLTERYLMHVKSDSVGEQNADLTLIHGLALLEGTRDPAVLAALWDIVPEQVGDTKDRLRRRHDFVLAGAPWLHQEVRDSIRRYLLDADQRARVRAANARAAATLRGRLSDLGLDTVEAQLSSNQWRSVSVALLWHTLWEDDRQGIALLAHLLPAATLVHPEFGHQLLRTTTWFMPVFPGELRSLTAGLQALMTTSGFQLRLRDMLDKEKGLRPGTARWMSRTVSALERGCCHPDGILAADVPAAALLDLLRAAYPRTFGVESDQKRAELLFRADRALPEAASSPGDLSRATSRIASYMVRERWRMRTPDGSVPPELLRLAEIAAHRQPEWPKPWTDLAWLYLESDLPAEGLRLAERAVQIDECRAASHHVRGIALRRLGRPDHALACYDRALQLDPDSANTHEVRGYLLWLMGRYQDAADSLTKAIDLNPGNGDTRGNRGEQFLILGRTTEAIADLREAIDLGATLEPSVLLALAILRADRSEAIRLCREALEKESASHTQFRRGELRAWAYLISGDAEAAEAEFRTVAVHRTRDDPFIPQEYELLSDVPGIERLLSIWREIGVDDT